MEDKKIMLRDGSFLRKGPIKTPEAVIKEFYMTYDLEEVKIMIWKMFKGAMSTDISLFNLPEENDYVIYFLENFILFNMAVFELCQRWELSE